MPINTATIIYFTATLTAQAVGDSAVRSVTFESAEKAEQALEMAGYVYTQGIDAQVWKKAV